jgi:hypothetical protein
MEAGWGLDRREGLRIRLEFGFGSVLESWRSSRADA